MIAPLSKGAPFSLADTEAEETKLPSLEAQARAINGTHPQMPQWMQDMGRDQAAVYCSGGRAASRVGAQRYADCKAWFPTVTH